MKINHLVPGTSSSKPDQCEGRDLNVPESEYFDPSTAVSEIGAINIDQPLKASSNITGYIVSSPFDCP